MRRVLIAGLITGMLVPGVVRAAPEAPARTTVLVMVARGTPKAEMVALHDRAGAVVTGEIPEVGAYRVSVPASAVPLYERSPSVVAVAAPRVAHIMARPPNDPLVRLQWGLRKLDAFDAWEVGKKLAEVQVAVIDTGVDASHIDMEGRVLGGYDYLELDDDSYDDHGHGTHVAGIIVANAANRKGVAGLAPNATVIPMKACAAGGSCDLFSVYVSAIDSVQRGADIINMSLGAAGECDDIGQAVFDWVRDQGTLTVVSAGNSGGDDNPTITPANCDGTLGVGASDQQDRKAEFSSFGDFVDIAAPGVGIWSTLPSLVSITSPYIGYGPLDGTSMAAPFVAAAAAVVKGRHPEWSPDQIERRLLSTATDVGRPGRDDRFGKGILNLLAAVR